MKKRPPDGTLALPRPVELDIAGQLRRAGPVLLIVGVWLACHPYGGIVHDARLYVAQAMYALQPDIFARDLFFAFGSQDDYTLFSRLFAPLVGAFGPTTATMLYVAVSHILWLGGAAALALRLAPGRPAAIVGLLLVAGLPALYGGWQLIAYGESFATARLPAEAVSFWALRALLDRRLAIAGILAVVTALLHPIVALTAIGVGFCFLLLGNWRWAILAAAGLGGIGALAVAGIAPFDALRRTMDAEWLTIVEQRNIFVFPTLWQVRDWAQLALFTATAATAALLLGGWRRRFVLAAVVAGLGGVLVAAIGADWLQNVLIIQLQIWRTLWLLQVVACLGLGVLAVRLWRLDGDGYALVSLVVLAWAVALMLGMVAGLAIAAGVYLLALLRLRGALGPLRRPSRVAAVAVTAALVVLLVAMRIWIVRDLLTVAPVPGGFMAAFGNVSPIEWAAALAVAWLVAWRWPARGRTVLALGAIALLILSAAIWDRRSEWTLALTTGTPPVAFDAVLAPDAQVYWENDVRGAWNLLRRPSYFSAAQGAGLLFQRDTAIEYRRRAAVIAPLLGRDPMASLDDIQEMEAPPLPILDRVDLVAACRSDPLLDALVLSRQVQGAYVAEWSLPAPIYDARKLRKGEDAPPLDDFYLYDCTALR